MSADIVLEEVPKFRKRSYADHVFQGSNNSIIVLGTDRAKNGPAGPDDGYGSPKSDGEGKDSGAMYFAVGRKDQDPDLKDDKSYVYISMKSDADENLGLENIETKREKIPLAAIKSDVVRIVYRKDFKLAHDSAKHYVYVDDQKLTVRINKSNDLIKLVEDRLELGENPSDWMALASLVKDELKALKETLDALVEAFNGHTHNVTTSGGPTSQAGTATSILPFSQAQKHRDIQNVKSAFVKSK
jgi:hypothetical protein